VDEFGNGAYTNAFPGFALPPAPGVVVGVVVEDGDVLLDVGVDVINWYSS